MNKYFYCFFIAYLVHRPFRDQPVTRRTLYKNYQRITLQESPGPEAVDMFQTYLLHGNKTEGLEYAMRAGLWGHALFLAS